MPRHDLEHWTRPLPVTTASQTHSCLHISSLAVACRQWTNYSRYIIKITLVMIIFTTDPFLFHWYVGHISSLSCLPSLRHVPSGLPDDVMIEIPSGITGPLWGKSSFTSEFPRKKTVMQMFPLLLAWTSRKANTPSTGNLKCHDAYITSL